MKAAGKTWNEVSWLAQDRDGWKKFVSAYAPPGAKRIDDEYPLFMYVGCVTAATLCDPRTIFVLISAKRHIRTNPFRLSEWISG